MEKFKLPKKVKEKWIKALRSGKYEQGMGSLYNKRDNTYCCLGVACKIGLSKPGTKNNFIPDKSFLPHCIQEKLAAQNDLGKSFKQISNWIKKNL